jgi:hypothetical protein
MGLTRGARVRCPVCGEGVLTDIAYDEHHPLLPLPKQAPESRELLTFSCGHEAEDRLLGQAERDDPNVERRETSETVMPIGQEGAPS